MTASGRGPSLFPPSAAVPASWPASPPRAGFFQGSTVAWKSRLPSPGRAAAPAGPCDPLQGAELSPDAPHRRFCPRRQGPRPLSPYLCGFERSCVSLGALGAPSPSRAPPWGARVGPVQCLQSLLLALGAHISPQGQAAPRGTRARANGPITARDRRVCPARADNSRAEMRPPPRENGHTRGQQAPKRGGLLSSTPSPPRKGKQTGGKGEMGDAGGGGVRGSEDRHAVSMCPVGTVSAAWFRTEPASFCVCEPA